MKDKIIKLHEQPKQIDLSYFNNYGGDNYSESYKNYTVSPAFVVNSLIDNHIDFRTLLDAGCASGELVRDFRRLGVEAYGIEKNTEILKKCVVPQYCTKMDLLDLTEIDAGTFDVVYVNSLMYILPHLIKDILKEFNRICNKAVYLCNPFLEKGIDTFPDPFRVFLATETWWDKQFEEADFDKIDDSIYIK